MLASTPLLVTVLNSILVAAILALLALQLGAGTAPALLFGAVGFTMGAFLWYAGRDIARAMKEHKPMFPASPPTDGA